jgi:hypothetical protein
VAVRQPLLVVLEVFGADLVRNEVVVDLLLGDDPSESLRTPSTNCSAVTAAGE